MEKGDIDSNKWGPISSEYLASDDGREAVGNAEEVEWTFVFSGRRDDDVEITQPRDKITVSHAVITHKNQTEILPRQCPF